MALAITTEQEQLAAAVSQFAARHAPVDKTRAAFESIAAGKLPPWWEDLVASGFNAVHVAEDFGGQGGTLADMGCVIEAAAAALLPGPLLSTVTAIAVARDAESPTLLSDLVGGATAVVILPEHSSVRAVRRPDHWELTGTSDSTLGLCSARHILLTAQCDDGVERWFAVAAHALSVEQQRGTDLCTDVGILSVKDLAVPNDSVLLGISSERARCITVALAACAAAGTLRRCAEEATDYLRTREQFGRPIGTFQALQHKAAALRVNAELAAAAAWDAVRAEDESIEQHRLAAAVAARMAITPSPELALDALLMFGAVGYTWEHDAHLYWRRATSLAASLGPATQWSRQIGRLVLSHKRSTAVELGDIEAEFRQWVADVLDRAAVLRNEYPADDTRNSEGLARGSQRNAIAEAGLVAPQLPAPWGVGAGAVQQVILGEEYAKRPDVVRPSLGIAEWILPTILTHGTDSQRDRFAWPILRGELRWCQLFSEPGAGSDLASLTTRAVKVDGGWRVNGRKIWTSLADKAQFGAMLARTDPDARKHQGISYFLVDMTSPGVEVTPIKQASGRSEFNEVLLTDVFIPDDLLVGNPGDGWMLALSTMAVERTAIGNYVEHDRTGALRHVAESEGPEQDAALLALGDVEAYSTAIKMMVLRETLRQVQGQQPGPTSSMAKYAMVSLLRLASASTLGVTGRLAMLEQSEPAIFQPYFDAPAELIGGGTAEIQLTVIASMILGLPQK
ncbi:acyl-CoA dehydrogenase [Mycobacterium sp. OTB74]|uniref:acyl-CoA dehydrogenase n=1 Tax=Mycobacterium sp. OTB74 TaxID=1853452 RepID=UPI002476DB72|nr:acyl-CoA dehydrogenase [Mycobacterium sp. OTB74]MDH6244081.1 alkylation response protein AidB-like acyl-CoA dehydrogenase [Mycobacterium sp. OTB74]